MNIHIDQKARKAALNEKESFIVQAPAGSGKTELLTQRFLRLLSHTPNCPEEIVAITFTKKAASEMRERILQALHDANNEQPSLPHKKITWNLARQALARDRNRNWNIIDNPSRLKIMTIDALNLHINQFAPLLSEMGSQPLILEDAYEIYREAALELLSNQSHPSIKQSLKTLSLHLDNRSEYLSELLILMLQKREQWLVHIVANKNDPQALRQYLEASLRHVVTEELQRLKASFPRELLLTLIPLAQQAGKNLLDIDPENPLCKLAEISPDTPFDLVHRPIWDAITNLLLTQSHSWRKSVTIKQGLKPKSTEKDIFMQCLSVLENNSALLQSLQHLRLCPPHRYTDPQWNIILALLQLLPLLVANLRVSMQTHGAIDFTEITLAALRALGDEDAPTDLALYFDYQIQHLLIDEFQDTSAIQFSLFERLIQGWQSGDGRTIFLVGDPMQSIYRFRNAEVSLFLHAKHRGMADIPLSFLQLCVNFRSSPTLVDWVNKSFSKIMPQSADTTAGAIPHSLAVSGNMNTQGNVSYYAGNELDSTFSNMIPQIINAIPDDQSIAILVRSRTQLRDIIPCLHNAEIAFNAIDIEPLNQRPEVQDLYSLTKAMLHLRDDIAWASILRAPWCGLTLNDLLIIHSHKERTWYDALLSTLKADILNANSQLRLIHFVNAIKPCIDNRGRREFHIRIRTAWEVLKGSMYLQTTQQLPNCEAYFELLRNMEDSIGRIVLDKFERQINKLYAQSSNNHCRIQIMTIHKSKGLEFDHVILPRLEHKGGSHTPALLQWLERPNNTGNIDLLLAPIKLYGTDQDSIYRFLHQTEKYKLEYESARLLYVACTRAKKELHLLARLEINEENICRPPRKGSHLGLLWPQHEKDFIESMKRNQSRASQSQDSEESNSLFRLKTKHLNNTNQYSDNHFQTQIEKLNLNITLEQPRIIGTIIHTQLQQIGENSIETWQQTPSLTLQSRWRRQLRQAGIYDSEEITQALDVINLAIKNTIACPKAKWFLSNNHDFAASEYAISQLKNGQIQNMIIDRVIVSEQQIWVIDYKISQPSLQQNEHQFTQEKMAQYRRQLEGYQQGLAAIFDLPVKCALYFPLCQQHWVEFAQK